MSAYLGGAAFEKQLVLRPRGQVVNSKVHLTLAHDTAPVRVLVALCRRKLLPQRRHVSQDLATKVAASACSAAPTPAASFKTLFG